MPEYLCTVMGYLLLSPPFLKFIQAFSSLQKHKILPTLLIILTLFLGACSSRPKPLPLKVQKLRIDTRSQKQAAVIDLVVIGHVAAQETFQALTPEDYFQKIDTLRLNFPMRLWRFECVPGQCSPWMTLRPLPQKHYGVWLFCDRGSQPSIKQAFPYGISFPLLTLKEDHACFKIQKTDRSKQKHQSILVFAVEKTTQPLQRRFAPQT